MCGRFTLIAEGSQLALALGLSEPPTQMAPRYNIAPTQPVAVVRHDGKKERELTHMHWGLIPSWSKDLSWAGRMINARSETVAEKPSFRNAFKHRRCLIPTTGFYEWQKTPDGKQPILITADAEIMAFAGLWEHWSSPDGSEIESCTIVTMAPNELMAQVHNRMPVILKPEDFDLWLDRHAPLPAVESLFKPYPQAEMHLTPVSKYVNNARNDGPRCIEPLLS